MTALRKTLILACLLAFAVSAYFAWPEVSAEGLCIRALIGIYIGIYIGSAAGIVDRLRKSKSDADEWRAIAERAVDTAEGANNTGQELLKVCAALRDQVRASAVETDHLVGIAYERGVRDTAERINRELSSHGMRVTIRGVDDRPMN